MSRSRKTLCVALAFAAALSVSVVGPVASAAEPLPTPVTAGALPTPQTDGVVFSVAIVGNTVYAGGKFTKARPAGVAPGGAGEVTRTNVLAFDLTSGNLLPWAPVISGSPFSGSDPGPFCKSAGTNQWICDTVFRIKAAPDGRKVYVGGDFDKINGQWRSRVAAFDATSGALDPAFRPQVAGRVRGLSITGDTVYLGGAFTSVNGVSRTRLAAVSLNGALLPWAPTADREVFAVLACCLTFLLLVGYELCVRFGDFADVAGGSALLVACSRWPAWTGSEGFRNTGWQRHGRADVAKSSADAGRREPAWVAGSWFPWAADLGHQPASQPQLGVCGHDQPAPAVS